MTSACKDYSLSGPEPEGLLRLRYFPAMAEREDNRWVTLVLVCLAQFMVILDATIVNIALPTIQQDLEFSQADLQWVVNSYTLLFGGFLLLGGRAADIVGRKKIFIAGTILFSVASLLNGLATSRPDEDERPFRSDAAENTTTPITNSLRRPTRSAARPPSSRKPPNTSV